VLLQDKCIGNIIKLSSLYDDASSRTPPKRYWKMFNFVLEKYLNFTPEIVGTCIAHYITPYFDYADICPIDYLTPGNTPLVW